MKVRMYTYVDVYYDEHETEKAKSERKRLEKMGYELTAEDQGNPYDNCDQYRKIIKTTEK